MNDLERVGEWFISGSIGLFLKIIYDNRKKIIKKLKKVKRKICKEEPLIPQPHFLNFGGIKTSWVVLDGDGISTYTPQSINMIYEPTPIDLPMDILELKARIQEEEKLKRERGEKSSWNGPRFCIKRFFIRRTEDYENLALDVVLGPSDYYTFLATYRYLDMDVSDIRPDPLKTPNPYGKTLRERYLQNVNWKKPIPYLANSLSVNILAITSDEKIIFTKRSMEVDSCKGHYDFSYAESLHRVLDMSDGNKPDIYSCVRRGAFEELGVEVKNENIVLLDFGLSARQYSYALQGYIEIDYTAKEVQDILRVIKAKDRWEAAKIEFVDFNKLDKVLRYVYAHGPWASPPLACIYFVLAKRFGHDKVIKTIKKLGKFRQYQDC
nr:hypothetical protein [Candidatus Baldrarchaeota archaeon]